MEVEGAADHHSKILSNPRSDGWYYYHRRTFELEPPELLAGQFDLKKSEVCKVLETLEAVSKTYMLFGMVTKKAMADINENRETFHKVCNRYRANQAFKKTVVTVLEVTRINGPGSWVKIFKWKFAAFFAHYMNQDIPTFPALILPESKKINQFFRPEVLIGGFYHDQLMSLRRRDSQKFFYFAVTSQQLKKAAPAVPDDMISKACADTLKELTEPQKEQSVETVILNSREHIPYSRHGNSKPKVLFELSKETITAELKRTCSELFKGQTVSYEEVVKPFFPSTSANYIQSRHGCGAVGELYALARTAEEGTALSTLGAGESLFDVGVTECIMTKPVSKHYGSLGRDEQSALDTDHAGKGFEPTNVGCALEYSAERLERRWETLYWELFERAKHEVPMVTVVGLPEPLKVRPITKGPPILYTVLKPFQRWLWSKLKTNRVFSLIGRYVLESDIQTCLGELGSDEEAVSGDYVSSTNRLHSWVSEAILEQLMDDFKESMAPEELERFPTDYFKWLRTFFLRALTKHFFVEDYSPCATWKRMSPEEKIAAGDEPEVLIPQTRGQLMGSIISFPFLCIANAALCRMALEKASRRVYRIRNEPLEESRARIAPLLVNGDDCLLKGPKGTLRICWEKICAYAGLESSVGKTYFSDQFCTINSTVFTRQYVEALEGSVWIEAKYINLGLMMGKKRTGLSQKTKDKNPRFFTEQVKTHELGVICHELKRSCPPHLWVEVKKEFIAQNKAALTSFEGIPWFLPAWLGGIGLPHDDEKISDTDLKCANLIRHAMNSDRKLRPVLAKDKDQWILHRNFELSLREHKIPEKPLFKGFLVPCGEGLTEFNSEDQYNKFYALSMVDILFKSTLKEITQKVDKDSSAFKATRKNMDMYARARKLLPKYGHLGPIPLEDLKFENKELFPPVFAGKLEYWSRFNLDWSLLLCDNYIRSLQTVQPDSAPRQLSPAELELLALEDASIAIFKRRLAGDYSDTAVEVQEHPEPVQVVEAPEGPEPVPAQNVPKDPELVLTVSSASPTTVQIASGPPGRVAKDFATMWVAHEP